MEPMVVGALGIVIYCGYITVKDLVTDLRQEGLMQNPIFSRVLTSRRKKVMVFFKTDEKPFRGRFANNSLILAPCRSDAGRLHRMHTR
jgi:hypothetical protein